MRLPTQVRSLLELESGAKDPTAVFLTMSLITVINRISLEHDGLYPVLSLTLVPLAFGVTTRVGGSGFLAFSIAGVALGDRAYVHKRSLTRFHDGLAWLAQIGMFLTLGLLILPSRIVPVISVAVLVTVFLMLVARPLAVYISLLGSCFGLREQTLVGWTGLRGAVPYEAEPVWAGEPVLRELVEYRVPGDSPVVGRQIAQAGLPSGADVVLLQRYDAYVVVRGSPRLRRDGVLLVLADEEALQAIEAQGELAREPSLSLCSPDRCA